MKDLLGGKGANLSEMTRAGLHVPPGFTITTEACLAFSKGNRLSEGLLDQIAFALKQLGQQKGQTFGDAGNPLLVSVCSR